MRLLLILNNPGELSKEMLMSLSLGIIPAFKARSLLIMSLTAEEVKKIAHLARLNLSEDDVAYYTPQLSRGGR